jgi:hypothetical protein
MCDAKDYREKAQLFIHAAKAASNKQVHATLLSLAQSALIATQLETKPRAIEEIYEQRRSRIAKVKSEREKRGPQLLALGEADENAGTSDGRSLARGRAGRAEAPLAGPASLHASARESRNRYSQS